MIVAGIDPGQDGAWALFHDDQYLASGVTPVIDKLIEGSELVRRIAAAAPAPLDLVVIELVGARPRDGGRAMFNFGYNTGLAVGHVHERGWPICRPTPQVWKRNVIPHVRGLPREAQKVAACKWVAERYPMVDLYPGRKRTPHDGIAEAVCLALYGLDFMDRKPLLDDLSILLT